MNTSDRKTEVAIGWAQADITPDKPVLLAGQFHARVSEGITDPVMATALAIDAATSDGTPRQVVMVTCDLATISDDLRDAVREQVRTACAALAPQNLFIGATHTHSAPDARMNPYGMEFCRSDYKDELLGRSWLPGRSKPSIGCG